MGRSTEKETGLSEQTEVPELDGASRSWRSCWPALRGDRSREGGLPRARDLGDALLRLARPAAGGGRGAARRQGGAPGRAGAAPQGRRAGAGARDARPTSWRSREKRWRAGSERARRPVPRLVAEGYAARDGGARACRSAGRRSTGCRRRGRVPQRRPPADPVEQAIVAEALANQTDGYRMVCRLRPPHGSACRSTASGCCG